MRNAVISVALFSVMLIFLFPVESGPFPATHGPATALHAKRNALLVTLAILVAGLVALACRAPSQCELDLAVLPHARARQSFSIPALSSVLLC